MLINLFVINSALYLMTWKMKLVKLDFDYGGNNENRIIEQTISK